MKCPHCNKVPYPAKNEDGSWNWKNLWRIDMMTIVFVVLILIMAVAYKHDTKECFEIIEDPLGYCEGYCQIIEQQKLQPLDFELNLPEDGTKIPRD